jgi:hypothetical protein
MMSSILVSWIQNIGKDVDEIGFTCVTQTGRKSFFRMFTSHENIVGAVVNNSGVHIVDSHEVMKASYGMLSRDDCPLDRLTNLLMDDEKSGTIEYWVKANLAHVRSCKTYKVRGM